LHGENAGLGAWEISGLDIADLARAFDVPFHAIGSGRRAVHVADKEFKLRRAYSLYGEDYSNFGEVLDILARIDGPQMLSIRVIEKWKEEDTQSHRSFSYHGRFSIEWED
jgi:hypothetical protein